jgi:hypothetical protein
MPKYLAQRLITNALTHTILLSGECIHGALRYSFDNFLNLSLLLKAPIQWQ